MLSSHEGLLKVLEMRLREMQNSCNENVRLRDEIDSLNVQANDLNGYIRELSNKYRMLKERKDRKVRKVCEKIRKTNLSCKLRNLLIYLFR